MPPHCPHACAVPVAVGAGDELVEEELGDDEVLELLELVVDAVLEAALAPVPG